MVQIMVSGLLTIAGCLALSTPIEQLKPMHLETSLELRRVIGDRRRIAVALHNLGCVYGPSVDDLKSPLSVDQVASRDCVCMRSVQQDTLRDRQDLQELFVGICPLVRP